MVFGGVRRALGRLRLERGSAPILFRRPATPPEIRLLLRLGLVVALVLIFGALVTLRKNVNAALGRHGTESSKATPHSNSGAGASRGRQ